MLENHNKINEYIEEITNKIQKKIYMQIDEKVLRFGKVIYNRIFTKLPPYYCMVEYAKMMADGGALTKIKNDKITRDITEDSIMGLMFADILVHEIDYDINNSLRLVELEKDLIQLVEYTDNDYFYRPLFFPAIFINNEFKFEGKIIKGILVEEGHCDEQGYTLGCQLPGNDLVIFSVAVDPVEQCEFYVNIALQHNKISRYVASFDNKKEVEFIHRMEQFVRTIVANVIDMVDGNEDLEIIKISTTREQNLKRLKRNQIQIPNKVLIRAKGELKKYTSNFKPSSGRLSHAFEVRGHWRHFRHERYKNMCGEKKWIYPYRKGQGILIKKEYKVEGKRPKASEQKEY